MSNSVETNHSAKVEGAINSMSKKGIFSLALKDLKVIWDKVSKGEKLGMNEEQLAKTAQKVADYLAKHEEPRNEKKTCFTNCGRLETKNSSIILPICL